MATDNKNTEPRNVTLKSSKVVYKRVKKVATESQPEVEGVDQTQSVVHAASEAAPQQKGLLKGMFSGKRSESNASAQDEPPMMSKKKHQVEEEGWLLGAGADMPGILKQTMRLFTPVSNPLTKADKEREKEEEMLKKKKRK